MVGEFHRGVDADEHWRDLVFVLAAFFAGRTLTAAMATAGWPSQEQENKQNF